MASAELAESLLQVVGVHYRDDLHIGVQHCGAVQVAGHQCPESRPLQEPVKWPFVGGR